MSRISKRIRKLETSVSDRLPRIICIDRLFIDPDGTWDGIIHRKHTDGQPPIEIGSDSLDWYPYDKY